jgi:hypothetical protein
LRGSRVGEATRRKTHFDHPPTGEHDHDLVPWDEDLPIVRPLRDTSDELHRTDLEIKPEGNWNAYHSRRLDDLAV